MSCFHFNSFRNRVRQVFKWWPLRGPVVAFTGISQTLSQAQTNYSTRRRRHFFIPSRLCWIYGGVSGTISSAVSWGGVSGTTTIGGEDGGVRHTIIGERGGLKKRTTPLVSGDPGGVENEGIFTGNWSNVRNGERSEHVSYIVSWWCNQLFKVFPCLLISRELKSSLRQGNIRECWLCRSYNQLLDVSLNMSHMLFIDMLQMLFIKLSHILSYTLMPWSYCCWMCFLLYSHRKRK